jgi:steroid delta-isomerase-like uncharacterized protein
MSSEKNKALIREWISIWKSDSVADVDFREYLTSDFTRHDPNVPEIHGPEAEQGLVAMYRTAFPDLSFTVDHLMAEGDMVSAHLTARGTHRGELMGIPPTGREVTVAVMELYRVEDGKIAEQWVVMDALGMLQELGAIPEPASAD